jgi:hypothetical protein
MNFLTIELPFGFQAFGRRSRDRGESAMMVRAERFKQ